MSFSTITITYYNSEGDEVSDDLPARMEVCETCGGHGTHLTRSIGEHAYTAEEFAESFDNEEAEEYFRHGGRYDVSCEECGGKNVVKVIDEERCTTAEQKAILVAYNACLEDRRAADAESAAERRMGC